MEWAVRCNAQHLTDYCQWWLRVNFEECSESEAFKLLPESMREKIEAERWPPLDYLERKAETERRRPLVRRHRGHPKPCSLQ